MGTIINFPKQKRKRILRDSNLPGFTVVTGKQGKITHLYRLIVDQAFGLDWSAPLVIEFDDPKAMGKRRDIHLKFLFHDGQIWKMRWMDRTVTPGKKRYGLFAA